MEPLLVWVLIASHLLLGVGVGWHVGRIPRKCSIAFPSPRPVCLAAIAALERDAAHQGLELTGFKAELDSGDFARSAAPAFRVNCLAESGRYFEYRMRDEVGRISGATHPEIEAIRIRVVNRILDYCGKSGAFCETLARCLDEQTPAEAGTVLTGLVTALLADNAQLSAELQQAGTELDARPGSRAAPRPAPLDSVTGLPNREAFRGLHAAFHARLQTGDEGYALVLYGIDHFAALRDQHGPEAADGVLRRFAFKLTGTMRLYDRAARCGDDTFAVLLPRCGIYEAEAAAERCRAAVVQSAARQRKEGTGYTVSAGVAAAFKGEPPQSVLLRAEQALHAARTTGNQVEVDFGIESHLRNAHPQGA